MTCCPLEACDKPGHIKESASAIAVQLFKPRCSQTRRKTTSIPFLQLQEGQLYTASSLYSNPVYSLAVFWPVRRKEEECGRLFWKGPRRVKKNPYESLPGCDIFNRATERAVFDSPEFIESLSLNQESFGGLIRASWAAGYFGKVQSEGSLNLVRAVLGSKNVTD